MLGEQLIKNDKIALVELLKNCYDADATGVDVDFNEVEQGANSPSALIAITDNGDGMDYDTITRHWLNPATPTKRLRKLERGLTSGGRVMQGEKGIGRFAIFKLGSRAQIVTRARGAAEEIALTYDLMFLDENVSGRTESAPVFLDEISVQLTRRTPALFLDGGTYGPHGTRIEITALRSAWNDSTIEGAYKEVARLRPLVRNTQVSQALSTESVLPFSIRFRTNGEERDFGQRADAQLERLFNDNAVLKVDGTYSATSQEFLISVNGVETILSLRHPEVSGLRVFKKLFPTEEELVSIGASPGSFDFSFFVFDLTPNAFVQYKLNADDKRVVKEHRIYLYRDGVRVLPYGDPDDDWLRLDTIRGTQGADLELSNDQTVGFVYITQSANPGLRDKTNREGLLEDGRTSGDLISLLQVILSWVRSYPFSRYRASLADRTASIDYQKAKVPRMFSEVASSGHVSAEGAAQLRVLERAYLKEREYLTKLVETTEDLAGVGLSVEAASHDLLAALSQGVKYSRDLQSWLSSAPCADDGVRAKAESLVESLLFVGSRMQDIQGLFVSIRQRRRVIAVADVVRRVTLIYRTLLERSSINVRVVERGSLSVFATDAALLQLLLNLFDNAVYWLQTAKTPSPQILIVLDAGGGRLVFSDNGPGISDEDAPYVFEPFYSGKGEAGKGLGLYIARQVGLRTGFEVEVASSGGSDALTGAVFEVTFDLEELEGKQK